MNISRMAWVLDDEVELKVMHIGILPGSITVSVSSQAIHTLYTCSHNRFKLLNRLVQGLKLLFYLQ